MNRHLDPPPTGTTATDLDTPSTTPPTSLPQSLQSPAARRRLVNDSAVNASAPTVPEPQAWDIRWLAGEDTQMPVLVMPQDDDAMAGGGPGDPVWWPVVPMWTDVESSLSSDLILTASDTTLGTVWRAVLTHQTRMPEPVLGPLAGRLTVLGTTLVSASRDGLLPPERCGPRAESTNDPRLQANSWIATLVGQALAGASEYQDEEHDTAGVREQSGSRSTSTAAAQVIELRPRFAPPSSGFALAAASHSLADECLLEPGGAEDIRATAELDAASNELRLRVTRLGSSYRKRPTVIVVTFKNRTTARVEAVLDTAVFVISSDLAVSEVDIEAVEVHLQ